MKFCIVLFALIAIAASAPQGYPSNQPEVSVVNYVNDNDGSGNYNFAFDLSDGTHRDEKGELKDVGGEEPAVVMSGSYSFTDDQGNVHKVSYTADENGFHPVVES